MATSVESRPLSDLGAMESAISLLHRRGEIEDGREDQVHGDNEENRFDDGRGGRTANLLGAQAGGESLAAADRSDGQPEHDALDQSAGDVADVDGVQRGGHIGAPGEARVADAE